MNRAPTDKVRGKRSDMLALIIPTLVGLLTAVAVFLLVGFVSNWIMEKITAAVEDERPREKPFLLSLLGKPFVDRVPQWMKERAEKMILYAGRPYDIQAHEVMGLIVLAVISGGLFGYLLSRLLQWPQYITVVTAFMGAFVPWIWLRDQVLRRHLRVMKDLPFHIDLLTLSVEAGLDFTAAVAKMVEKGRPGPVRDEFRMMVSEVRVGKTRADAMKGMSERVGLPALSSFLNVLIQADRLGTGIGRVLRIQADQLRIERSHRAEKQAGEAPVKMLLPLVLFVFPTIWLILAAPLVFEWIFKTGL